MQFHVNPSNSWTKVVGRLIDRAMKPLAQLRNSPHAQRDQEDKTHSSIHHFIRKIILQI